MARIALLFAIALLLFSAGAAMAEDPLFATSKVAITSGSWNDNTEYPRLSLAVDGQGVEKISKLEKEPGFRGWLIGVTVDQITSATNKTAFHNYAIPGQAGNVEFQEDRILLAWKEGLNRDLGVKYPGNITSISIEPIIRTVNLSIRLPPSFSLSNSHNKIN